MKKVAKYGGIVLELLFLSFYVIALAKCFFAKRIILFYVLVFVYVVLPIWFYFKKCKCETKELNNEKVDGNKKGKFPAIIRFVVLRAILFCAIPCVVVISSVPFSCLCPEYFQSIPFWLWSSVSGILILLVLLTKKFIYLFITWAIMLGICVAVAINNYATCACVG